LVSNQQFQSGYKHKANGISKKLKARIVVKGFEHEKRLNHEKTFAPILMRASIKSLITLVAHSNWHIDHLDVKIAFLNDE
jgi:hypothetical protein